MTEELSVCGVMVTYRRPSWVEVSLDTLARQTRRLDEVVVVDNDPDESARAAAERAGARYLPAGRNRGMAGGLHVGLEAAGDRHDLVLVLDDDDPPNGPDVVEGLVDFFVDTRRLDPTCAAVGGAGALFDARSGRSRRPDMRGPGRALPVDWIGSGMMVLYDVSALRAVGGPDESLFFAYEDLDIGLRLRRAGHSLYRDRDHRTQAVFDLPTKTPRPSPDRVYYSTRNLVVILGRESGRRRSAAIAVRLVAAALVRNPGCRVAATRAAVAGALDGLRGRLGPRGGTRSS